MLILRRMNMIYQLGNDLDEHIIYCWYYVITKWLLIIEKRFFFCRNVEMSYIDDISDDISFLVFVVVKTFVFISSLLLLSTFANRNQNGSHSRLFFGSIWQENATSITEKA